MSKIGHIIGLIFALVLLTASKAFLGQYPLASAGFLMLTSFFYVVCTIVSNRSFFLYPVMFFGALSYYLCLHGFGVQHIWFPVHSILLISLLGVAKHIAGIKGKTDFSNSLFNGINFTVAIFTIWALSFAKIYWSISPLIYILTFFGYAAFYFLQNLSGQKKNGLVYARVYYIIGGFLALTGSQFFSPALKAITLSALVFAFAYIGINIHRSKGSRYALPFLSGVLISSLFTFIYVYAASNWNALSIAFFLNTIAFWFSYKSLKESIVGSRISSVAEKLFMTVFKAGFILLPVLFWVLLLRKGFQSGYSGIIFSLGYALFFSKLSNGLYKSLLKTRNHYVYLAGAFFTAAYYLLLFSFNAYISVNRSILLLSTPILIFAILIFANRFKQKGDIVRSNSLIDISLLSVAINFILLLSFGSFNPVIGLIFAGITAAVFIIFLVFLKDYTVCYPLALVLWGGIYSVLIYIGADAALFTGVYLVVTAIFALLAYAGLGEKKGLPNIFRFSLILFSLTALYFSDGNIGLKLSVLCYLAVIYLSLGACTCSTKGVKNIFSFFGHIAGFWVITTVVSNRLFVQAIYVTLGLAVGYFLPFKLHKKDKYAYPAGILASIGYLLLLIKICPVNMIMPVYLPLTAAFLFYYRRKVSLPARFCAHFSSGLVVIWALSAAAVNPLALMISFLLYGAIYIITGKERVSFCAAASVFLLAAFYFLLKLLLPAGQTLIWFDAAAFVFFIAGIVCRKNEKYKTWGLAVIIAGMVLLFFATAVSVITGLIGVTKILIITSSTAYILAALVFKKEIFLYLLTLNISILFFNFVQTSGSIFTQNLFIYFLYGVIFLGIFFIIPYIKKLRRYERVFMMFTITNWKGVLLYSIPVCFILLIGVMLYAIKITEHPQFCGSCHYMDDYIESWEHSTHKDVKCVDCHYEPGVKALAKGKIDGMLQLAKYMTHTYSSLPVAEVKDASCLRGGCHDKMDREAVITFGKNIKFRHSIHLDQRMVKRKLRCTTCHSQTEEGEHLSIAKTSCFTCHFKGKKSQSLDCMVCHKVPETTDDMDHREVLGDGGDVSCIDCHEEVTVGTGKIVSTNCLFCHTRKDARKKLSTEEMHDKHVSDYKAECYQCHEYIRHGNIEEEI